jgi:HlyD family secretion protein
MSLPAWLIQTGYRTVFSYLTKPVADNKAKAFREE